MWFLTPSRRRAVLRELRTVIGEFDNGAVLRVDEGTGRSWRKLELLHAADHPIAEVTWIPVRKGGRGRGRSEVVNFLRRLRDARPASAAVWLRGYLPRVRTAYQFRLYSGTEVNRGWESVRGLVDFLRDWYPGVLYAEFEGWSNEAGEQITWEFTGKPAGAWWMGLLIGGEWHRFQMELGSREQRECFQRGVVPPGVRVWRRPAEPSAAADPARRFAPGSG